MVVNVTPTRRARCSLSILQMFERGMVPVQRSDVAEPILHECRHGYASLMIAARVNVKALSTFMGHANIRVTLDQYGHPLPGAEHEAAELLDAFVARSSGGVSEPLQAAIGVEQEARRPCSDLSNLSSSTRTSSTRSPTSQVLLRSSGGSSGTAPSSY